MGVLYDTAPNAHEASQKAGGFCLIIMDIDMPEIEWDTAQSLINIQEELAIVGYTNQDSSSFTAK